MSRAPSPAVVWHDLECHGYDADLAVWRELARSPVLDVGAGTGRVALDLAAAGHDVTALDVDGDLLAELERRAAVRGLSGRIASVRADAQAFDLGRTFATVVVPMQTVQLLGDRAAFLRCAAAHLAPGGTVAVAIAPALEPFEPSGALPMPDVAERQGWRFASQPVAMRPQGDAMRIERLRTAWGPAGERTLEADAVDLARLDAATLEREAAGAGLRPMRRWPIPATDDHVASEVVVLGA